jgi:hypothetical protein
MTQDKKSKETKETADDMEFRAESRQSMKDALDSEYRKGAKFGFVVALIGFVLWIAGTAE